MSEIGAAKGLLDDTPVNGEVGKGITSNWAYDEDVTLRALIEATLPWTVFINPFVGSKSNVNWNTTDLNSAQPLYGYVRSSGAQNDEITWDLVLGAGTWTFKIITVYNNVNGIFSVQFDGVEKGTIDCYATDITYIQIPSIVGIVVPLTKKIELKLKMSTKNILATQYYGLITLIMLIRTA